MQLTFDVNCTVMCNGSTKKSNLITDHSDLLGDLQLRSYKQNIKKEVQVQYLWELAGRQFSYNL